MVGGITRNTIEPPVMRILSGGRGRNVKENSFGVQHVVSLLIVPSRFYFLLNLRSVIDISTYKNIITQTYRPQIYLYYYINFTYMYYHVVFISI